MIATTIYSMDLSQVHTPEKYYQTFQVNQPEAVFAPVGTAHAYDLIRLLALAIEQAGTTDPASVRNALEQLPPYTGVVKHYEAPFTPNRHEALDATSYFLARFDRKGQIVPMTATNSAYE